MLEDIDTCYDDQFATVDDLKWLPWIGKNYKDGSKNKLLLVGESHYDWGSHDSLMQLEDPDFTRWFIHAHTFENSSSSMKILRNTERALFQTDLTEKQLFSFWRSVAYYNIVQRILSGRKERPDQSDFLKAWNVFFKVIEIVRPRCCLFCGVEASNYTAYFKMACEKNRYKSTGIEWLDAIGSTYPRIATLNSDDNYQCNLIFIKHPSSHFSWRNWGAFVNKHINVT